MKSLNRRHQGRACLLILKSTVVTLSLISPSLAAEVTVVPACEIKEEYNDNVFLVADNKKSDFITTLTPGITFSRRSERSNVTLLTGLSWHRYAQTSGTGTTDFQYNAQVSNKLTPLDDMNLGASYIRNSRPDNINPATGSPVRTGSDTYQYTGAVKRLFNETTSASLEYSFIRNTYDNQESSGNSAHTAGLSVSKDLSALVPLLNGTVSSNFSRSSYRDSTNDYYTVSVGARRNFGEKVSVNLSVGGKAIHSTFANPSAGTSDTLAAIGSASLNYAGDNSFGSASFIHDFPASSGQASAVKTTSLGLTVGRNLSEKATAQVAATYIINQRQATGAPFSTGSADDRVLNFKTDIMYKISKFFDFELQYTYYTAAYSLNDSLVAQNSVMLRAVAKYPFTR
jgi:hypothetical protein